MVGVVPRRCQCKPGPRGSILKTSSPWKDEILKKWSNSDSPSSGRSTANEWLIIPCESAGRQTVSRRCPLAAASERFTLARLRARSDAARDSASIFLNPVVGRAPLARQCAAIGNASSSPAVASRDGIADSLCLTLLCSTHCAAPLATPMARRSGERFSRLKTGLLVTAQMFGRSKSVKDPCADGALRDAATIYRDAACKSG